LPADETGLFCSMGSAWENRGGKQSGSEKHVSPGQDRLAEP
jgi:hypothetical protein